MSCEIDISSEKIINVESESNIEIAGPSIEIDINKVPEYEIVVDKKEYIITGDNIYIPEHYDDAPQWLKDLVKIAIDISIDTNNSTLIGNLNKIISEFANQYVPLNQFTQSILALNTEDERINAFVTTLNSNFDSGLNKANAQIINLNLTKASKDEAEAIAINTLSAQLDTPSSKLGSVIGSIQQAIVNTNSASATSYDAIMSTLDSADNAIIAQASANTLLRTYVGMTDDGLAEPTIGLTGNINSLRQQLDGTIEYYYYNTGSPTEASVLASKLATWNTDAKRANANGDIVYFKDSTRGYWYSYLENKWNPVVDTSILQALKKAENAQASADGVVVSYYAVEQPTSAGIDTSKYIYWYNSNTLYKYISGSWVIDTSAKAGDTLTVYVTSTKDTKHYVRNSTNTTWFTNTPAGVVANSSAITNLTADLSAFGTTVGAHTTELNTVNSRISSEGARVETKWAYNSVVNINGTYRKSGFGLTTNYTSGNGTQANPYNSEFWIDASRLKFTNSNKTGSKAPFTIDASGEVPEIKFNGVVEFSNVLNASKVYTQDTLPGGTRQLGDLWIKPSVNGAQWYWDGSSWVYQDLAGIINSNTTTINGGKITTGSITAGQIGAYAINANNINTNGLIADDIRANVLTGKTLNGVSINGSTITGSIIKASYLDLRDDLTPVTDYVITPAVYASDPNRYRDSVYISGTNTYRIPSVIPLYSLATERSLGDYPNVLQNSIWSYQAANKGNTNKCVKRVPVLKIKEAISMRLSANDIGGSGAIFDSPTIEIKVGGVSSGHFKVNAIYDLEVGDRFSFRYPTLYKNGSVVSQYVDTTQTYTINGVPVVVSVSSGRGGFPMTPGSFTLSIPPGTYTLSSGFEGDTNSIIECAITVQGSRNPFFGLAFQNIHAVIGQMEITNNIFQGWDI